MRSYNKRVTTEGVWCYKCRRRLNSQFFSRKSSEPSGFRKECRECVRSRVLKTKYGLDSVAWDSLFEAQDRKCAICKSDSTYAWATDHDHFCCAGEKTCGKCVRGILCASCNGKLGWFETYRVALQGYLD